MSKWKDMVGTAFSLAIVGYVINLAMGRTLAAKHGYDVDPNQVFTAGAAAFALRREGKSSHHEWGACRRARFPADLEDPWLCAMLGEKGHGRALSCRLERGWKRERSFRLGSVPCCPSRLGVLAAR